MLSLDEMGSFSLIPHGGRGWFEQNDPGRISANYHKYEGVRYEYVCLNIDHQMLSVKQYESKGGEPWLEFLKDERSNISFRPESLHDSGWSLSHWTDEIQRWA